MKFFASPRSKQEQAPRQVAPGHDSRAIANIFVGISHKAGETLTITQLVKFVYFAHGWTLGYTGEPLIRDKVKAWPYGPVVPMVYRAFRPQGILIKAPAIDENGRVYSAKPSSAQREIISNVYKAYSHLTPLQLTDITHEENTPWHQYAGKLYHTIGIEEIKAHYKERVKELKQGHG